MVDAEELRRELIRPGGLWAQVEVVASTGSTNADLAAAARAGAPVGSVLVSSHQSAGRGRLGRTWTAPPDTSVAVSVLLRPSLPTASWTWLPLLTGLAVADGLRTVAGVNALVKWPNDVLVADRKICGILSELIETDAEPACVVGFGINLSLTEEQLPVPTATSLLLELGRTPPSDTAVVATVLAALELTVGRWEGVGRPDGLREAYLERCDTIGRPVRVELSGGRTVQGMAETVDEAGRLVLRTPSGPVSLGAGDVTHLRRMVP